jgi:hypothetical protein
MAFLSYNGLLHFWQKIKALLDGKVDKSEAGANSLLATLTTTWTAIPTDNTYFVRQDTEGGNNFGRVKFSTLWSYIKGKGDATYQPKGSYAASSHTHDDRYYTESEIDSKLSGKANNHSHPYLPLAGGTMSGTITFAAIGDKGTSAGLAFSGSTDGAGIYYQTTAGDQGNLVLNLTDDDNCYLQIAKNGAFKSYFSPDGVFHGSVAGNASSASSVAWSNVTGKPSTFTPSNHTHTKSQITDFPALGTAAAKNVRTLTAQGASGWKDAATDQQYVPDMSFIAYWNGAYSGTSSNLIYCNRGAFGTIVTKNTSDYAVAGHTHTWDSVTGKPSTFTPSSHTHGVIKSLSVNGTTITCTKDDGTTSTITTQDTNTTYGTFKGATTSEAGSTGLVIAPVAGNANRYLRSDGTWAVPPDTNTTYGVFAKATADVAGSTGLVPAPAKGQQTYYLRGDGTWAVPANTWRGIQDNLTSSSNTDSLSANQGKVLKGLIDGKAASGHTHNYAGSSSAGGAATSANKVNAALTINLNGTSQGAWDGSSAKSISITAASVGATSVTISRW